MLQRWRSRIGWLFTAELCVLWAFGSFPVWLNSTGTQALAALRPISVAGLLACAACVMAMTRARGALADWQGTLQFVACWTDFPLFKAVRDYWIHGSADRMLLGLDRRLWGGVSLPQRLQGLQHVGVSELLSAAYLSFYVVVPLSVWRFTRRRHEAQAKGYLAGLSWLYLVGFAGYALVPAAGPYLAFPALFATPLPAGPVATWLQARVAQGITGMDVFPSLHLGVFGFLTLFVVTSRPRRGRGVVIGALAGLTLGIAVATVYLRYHYGIDLVAGLLLGLSAVGIARAVHNQERSEHASEPAR